MFTAIVTVVILAVMFLLCSPIANLFNAVFFKLRAACNSLGAPLQSRLGELRLQYAGHRTVCVVAGRALRAARIGADGVDYGAGRVPRALTRGAPGWQCRATLPRPIRFEAWQIPLACIRDAG